MKANRISAIFKTLVTSRICQLNGKSPTMCQYSTLAAATRRRSFFPNDCGGESSVYQHALKFQKPSTINYQQELENSVSFIGTVEFGLKRVATHDDTSFGFYTILKVRTSSQSSSYLKVLLMMWDKMAALSINHVKPSDLIYVSGYLGTYPKTDMNDNPRMLYEVVVKELNYVAQNSEGSTNPESKKVDLEGADYLERARNRLHLWQIFFARPYEWTDFRKSKKTPKHPDFKNKSTGEALWLHHSDPPWIRKQLELHDSAFFGQIPEANMRSASCVPLLVTESILE